jgi:hypothetical protein
MVYLTIETATYHKGDWPVNKIEVKVLQLKSFQRSFNGRADIFGTVVSVPELAGNKDLVAGNLGFSESLTDFMFILICGSPNLEVRSHGQMRKLYQLRTNRKLTDVGAINMAVACENKGCAFMRRPRIA